MTDWKDKIKILMGITGKTEREVRLMTIKELESFVNPIIRFMNMCNKNIPDAEDMELIEE